MGRVAHGYIASASLGLVRLDHMAVSMPFWNRRVTGSQVTDGSAARDLAPHLEPIRSAATIQSARLPGRWRVVAPPPRATDPQRRISRRRNRLVALVGSYVVTGTAHIQPGATLDPYTLRRQVRFLPLTDAWVTHRTEPSVDMGRPVLIVNTMNLIELRPAMTVV